VKVADRGDILGIDVVIVVGGRDPHINGREEVLRICDAQPMNEGVMWPECQSERRPGARRATTHLGHLVGGWPRTTGFEGVTARTVKIIMRQRHKRIAAGGTLSLRLPD
jgi:hypothetical protein